VNINDVHENWTALGKDDPLWVVLTDPSKKGNKWDQDEFFATGKREIEESLKSLRDQGIPLRFNRCLDFGCGVGRLSQALAEHFELVDGVDVSASMIEHARRLNRYPAKVTYHLNIKSDLSDFPSASYDFAYSMIALQHTPPSFQRSYISEFVRLLAPGGVAFFQTIHAHGWRAMVPHACADLYRKVRSKGQAFIPMYGTPVAQIQHAVKARGGIIRGHKAIPYAGHESRYFCDYYTVTKS
jgi:2-polyprenyl-3-methyl-5-hydroxy-6-metoxy-1,4-benzoquinol methylase